MKIEVGKTYRMRNGGKCEIVADMGQEDCPLVGIWRVEQPAGQGGSVVCLTRHGLFWSQGSSPFDLIDEWREPRKGVAWVNVYSETEIRGQGCYFGPEYSTRAKADSAGRPSRIACVRVEWTEGQFDE